MHPNGSILEHLTILHWIAYRLACECVCRRWLTLLRSDLCGRETLSLPLASHGDDFHARQQLKYLRRSLPALRSLKLTSKVGRCLAHAWAECALQGGFVMSSISARLVLFADGGGGSTRFGHAPGRRKRAAGPGIRCRHMCEITGAVLLRLFGAADLPQNPEN